LRARCALLAASMIALLVAGCGFELRGSNVLTGDPVQIYLDAPTLVRNEVAIYLEGSNSRLLRSAEGADVIVTVGSEVYDRRVLSVDPNTGKEREFEVSLSIPVTARSGEGKVLLPQQTITLLRDYVFDSDQLIGASREESVLRLEMRRDAAQQLLFKLRSAMQG
jgi:LPS-assembly lipoprotein